MRHWYSSWPPYVSVAEKKRRAERHSRALKRAGWKLRPVVVSGRKIAKTFWGQAWCRNLES